MNSFNNTSHKKIITGVQKLYIIGKKNNKKYIQKIFFVILFEFSNDFFSGLVDPLPINSTLEILKTFLPQSLFNKLNKYVTSDPQKLNCSIDWKKFKSILEKKCDLQLCSNKLLTLLEQNVISEKNVKTFHIENNFEKSTSTEPTQKNTLKMVTNFLISIYQRNILASLIKYILLKPLLQIFETSNLISTNKGIFSSMYQRLNEIIFESILTAFNGS